MISLRLLWEALGSGGASVWEWDEQSVVGSGSQSDSNLNLSAHRDQPETHLQEGHGPGEGQPPVVWDGAGIHPAGHQWPPLWLARQRLPRPAG